MIRIHLPDDAYAVYARLAARKGVTVSQYLTDTARAHTGQQRAVVDEFHANVTRLHGLGWDDGRIAVALDRPRNTVATVRKRLGLQPNKRKDT